MYESNSNKLLNGRMVRMVESQINKSKIKDVGNRKLKFSVFYSPCPLLGSQNRLNGDPSSGSKDID